MVIEIHNLQKLIPVDFDHVMRAVKTAAGEDEPAISISLVSDQEIRAVNREHLGRDRPTDVIAFDYRSGDLGEGLSGEVILSAETAARVAAEKKHAPTTELILYVVHGVLHLAGYDDRDPEAARAMWARQKEVMDFLGLSGDFAI